MQCILEQWGANELCEATVRFRKGLLTVFTELLYIRFDSIRAINVSCFYMSLLL